MKTGTKERLRERIFALRDDCDAALQKAFDKYATDEIRLTKPTMVAAIFGGRSDPLGGIKRNFASAGIAVKATHIGRYDVGYGKALLIYNKGSFDPKHEKLRRNCVDVLDLEPSEIVTLLDNLP